MKTKIFVVLAIVLLTGCVSAKYNPETKEVSYLRIGDQKVNGFEASLPDGSVVKFESQESQAQLLLSAMELLKQGVKIGAGK